MRGLLELRGIFEGGSYMRKYDNCFLLTNLHNIIRNAGIIRIAGIIRGRVLYEEIR